MKIIDYTIQYDKTIGTYFDIGNDEFILCSDVHDEMIIGETFSGFVFEDGVVRKNFYVSFYKYDEESGNDYMTFEYAKKARYRINED